MKLRTAMGALLVVLAAGGCMRAKHLVYVYDAAVGLDVAYSTEGTGRLLFGYERDTFALVPQKCDGPDDDECEGEIMKLAAVSQVRARGVDELCFNHFVATGDSAASIASDPAGIAKIRRAIFGTEETRPGDQSTQNAPRTPCASTGGGQ